MDNGACRIIMSSAAVAANGGEGREAVSVSVCAEARPRLFCCSPPRHLGALLLGEAELEVGGVHVLELGVVVPRRHLREEKGGMGLEGKRGGTRRCRSTTSP